MNTRSGKKSAAAKREPNPEHYKFGTVNEVFVVKPGLSPQVMLDEAGALLDLIRGATDPGNQDVSECMGHLLQFGANAAHALVMLSREQLEARP